MNEFVGDLREEFVLCPVRVLRIYLERTIDLSPRSRSLFVSSRALLGHLNWKDLPFLIELPLRI